MADRWAIKNFVGSAGVVFAMSLGCGGVQEEPAYAQSEPPPLPTSEPARGIEAPEATKRALKACVDGIKNPWAEASHAFQYNLDANERGKVVDVKLHGATVRDGSLEACFKRALEAMVVPDEALRMRVVRPVSGGESMSWSRGDVGIVQAAAAPIALAPILIPALGVTIIVAISLDIIRKAASGPDCKEVKEDCIVACNHKLPTSDYGFQFWNCVNQCMRTAGC